MTNLLYFTR